jgi:hypothetical protein
MLYRILKIRMKIIAVVLFGLILISCKRDYSCICRCTDISSGQVTIVGEEVIHDTERRAEKRCTELWYGDECG